MTRGRIRSGMAIAALMRDTLNHVSAQARQGEHRADGVVALLREGQTHVAVSPTVRDHTERTTSDGTIRVIDGIGQGPQTGPR